MTALSPNDLYWLERRFEIAAEEVRRLTPEMSADELRSALKGVPGSEGLTIGYAPGGNQIVTIGDRTVEVGPMASNGEILAALQNPFVPTANTKVKMASPLQGIGQKLGLLKHNAEAAASKLSARVDQLSGRMDSAVNKSLAHLDGQEKDVIDVENFVTDIEKATNA